MLAKLRHYEACLRLRQSSISVLTEKTRLSFSAVPLHVDGKTFLVEEMADGDMKEASQLFIQANGDGYGPNEFISDADVADYMRGAVVCTKLSYDDTILGIFGIKACHLTRSQKPLYKSAFIFFDESIRGKGLSSALLRNFLPQILPETSLLTRTGVMGSASALIKTGCTCLGVIPGSMQLPNNRFTDNLIVISSQDIERDRRTPMSKEDLNIPPLRRSKEAEKTLNNHFSKEIFLPKLYVESSLYNVQLASNTELWVIEDMIREAALSGDGFALDEFTSDGYSNRSFVKEPHNLVVKDSRGDVKAGVIFGSSGLCRETNPTQVGGYVIVEKVSRGMGIGSRLLTYCIDNATSFGYTTVLVDVFGSNSTMINMLIKRGFLSTGTIPNCGYISNRGRTNSLIFFRQI